MKQAKVKQRFRLIHSDPTQPYPIRSDPIRVELWRSCDRPKEPGPRSRQRDKDLCARRTPVCLVYVFHAMLFFWKRDGHKEGEKVATSKMPSHLYKFQMLKFEEITPNSKLNPKARSGHRMVADAAGDLYSFGGYHREPAANHQPSPDPELFQELWKFNWGTRRWKKLRATGDIPDRLVSHCMCYWNEKIIIYGGTGIPYGDTSSNKLSIYHIAKNSWEVVEPLSDPTKSPMEMYGQACICDEQKGEIYIVGGTNGSQYSLDVHKFNLFTKKWTQLYKSIESDYEPGCRYRHEIALFNNRIYLFGGSTSHDYYGFDQVSLASASNFLDYLL